MNGSIARLTGETRAIGAFMEEQATAITGLDMTQPAQAKKAKQLVNRTAERLFSFGRRVDRELPPLHEAAVDAIGSVGRAALLAPDFGPGAARHLTQNLSALQHFQGAVSASRGYLAAWRQQVERMPRVTTRFNKAKRETLEVLSRIDKELAATESLNAETGRLIEEALENFRAI